MPAPSALSPARILQYTLIGLLSLGMAQAAASDDSSTTTKPVMIGAVPMPPAVRLQDTELPLVNAALLRFRVFFKPYVAGLYLPPATAPKEWATDVPKALHIHYLWALKADEIGPAGRTVIARTQPAEAMAALTARLDQFDAAYQDVSPGDTYTLFYRPGHGTALVLNGEPLVLIPGADFAAAYFSIWLGEDPVEKRLRRALLTRAKPGDR